MQFLFSTMADCCIVYGGPLALSFFTCPAVLSSHYALIRCGNPSVTKTRVEDRSSNESHFGARGALPRPNQQGLSGWYTPTSTSPTTLLPSHAATCFH